MSLEFFQSLDIEQIDNSTVKRFFRNLPPTRSKFKRSRSKC